MAPWRRHSDLEHPPERDLETAPAAQVGFSPPAGVHADPAALVQALAGADVGTRATMIARMQGGAGNASVARALRRGAPPTRTAAPAPAPSGGVITRVERYPFSASIRRGPPVQASGPDPVPVPASRSDAPRGAEHGQELASLFESLGGAAGEAPGPVEAGAATSATTDAAPGAGSPTGPAADASSSAPATAPGDGAPISVPDIEIPILAEVGKSDAISGAFTYSGSIKHEGAAPRGFGVTRSFDSKLTGITITPKASTFEVVATLEHPITYQVRSGTGPQNQKDIASETDADITKAKYPTVHSDLTPDMSDLNGRPPRTEFWAEDLTLKHELVHANDDQGNGPGAMATVKTWLDGQTAADAAGVQTHLGNVPGRFASALLAALSTEDGEKHAYGDGAPSYKARADKIKEKGDKGDYV